ncbi:MAG: diacylglycerol/polyprenol kinase family protein [Anaerolineaceae bacterium]
MHNIIALIVTLALALVWLRANDYFAHRGWVSSNISRKIIHIGTGPIFVLCWLFFDQSYGARFYAAVVPLLITLQFLLVGIGVIKDQSAVDAMSRKGNRREILKGPLFYGIAFVVLTIVYWSDAPTGIIGLMMLCGGDGLAEVIGSRFGRSHLFWSKKKTWLGTLGMFLGGILFSIAILAAFIAAGIFTHNIWYYTPAVVFIGLAATFFESLPFEDYDNIVIPVVVILSSLIFLPKG